MKTKKIFLAIASLAIVAAVCTTVLTVSAASTTTGSSTTSTTAQADTTLPPDNHNRPALTDAQKAEMDAQRTAMDAKRAATDAKWTSLTDAQKASVFAISDQMATVEKQMVDKQLELGLIDEATATAMKTQIDTKYADMKTNGKVPMLGGGGHRGGHRGGPMGHPPADQTTTAAAASGTAS